MNELGVDVDYLLDNCQQMIDMIRKYGDEDQCDAWEVRLYQWHDMVLEVSAAARIKSGGQGNVVLDLTEEQKLAFRDIVELHQTIIESGNAIFLPHGDQDRQG
jgi:hypothetical protein